MWQLLCPLGAGQYTNSLLQLTEQFSKTPNKNVYIKIDICIRGWEDGDLYHRKEILANQSWLM